MKSPEKSLIVVVGPTASGKTDVAIKLAEHFNTEIISADSRQFYREIPIGTAAPDSAQLKIIKHHFVGHLSINDDYNVSMFENDTLAFLEDKFKTHNQMILVGGSGLYIDAVCRGIDDLPDPTPELRAEIQALYDERGIDALREKLRVLDPVHYNAVDQNNPTRLMRALEVCLQTGRPYSELRQNQAKQRDFNIIKIGLEVPRELLIERINERTDLMMHAGWLEEARKVYPKRTANALNTVGYKELFKYIDGEWDLEFAIEKIRTNTRRYAKRQMTWFRKDPGIRWFEPEKIWEMVGFIESVIKA